METAVRGGSLSILSEGKLLDYIVGGREVSGAENLLPQIKLLLSENKIQKKDLDLIAVSIGPGSFTGIRIGIATAIALEKATGKKCVGVDLLKALAIRAQTQTYKKKIIAAVVQGRNRICYCEFESEKLRENEYVIGGYEDFISRIHSKKKRAENFAVVSDSGIYSALVEKCGVFAERNDIINAGDNLSGIIARAVFEHPEISQKPQPLYLGESNFLL